VTVRRRARPRTSWALLLAGLLALLGACAPEVGELGVELEFEPAPPAVGTSRIELVLTDPEGALLQGARVHVEGNMNHAGMTPSLAAAEELGGGRYAAELEFTMGGDWFLVVTAVTEDGRRYEKVVDVPGVSRS